MKHNWEYKRLGDVCTLHTYKGDLDSFDGKYWLLNLDKIQSNTGSVLDFEIYEKEVIERGSTTTFGKEYVLYSKLRPNLNKVVIPQNSGYCTTELVPIQPKETTSPYYLAYFLRSPHFVSFIIGKVSGAKMPRAKMSDFWKAVIPMPSKPKQELIVAELDKINDLIAMRKEQLRKLDNLAQSLFYDTFGDPITNPKGWPTCHFKDSVVQMHIGPFGSALKTDAYVSEENGYCIVYEQKHAIKSTLEQNNHYISKEKYLELQRFEVIPGDFIMSCRGTIGKLYQIPKNAPLGIIHPSLMKIRINDKSYSPEFFFYFLPLIIEGERTKGNCVQMAITAKELGAKILPLPPLKLQQQFARKVEAIEAQKQVLNESLKELQTLLDSRMDYWFN